MRKPLHAARIGGVVLAAGVGVAMATSTPVATAVPDSGTASSAGGSDPAGSSAGASDSPGTAHQPAAGAETVNDSPPTHPGATRYGHRTRQAHVVRDNKGERADSVADGDDAANDNHEASDRAVETNEDPTEPAVESAPVVHGPEADTAERTIVDRPSRSRVLSVFHDATKPTVSMMHAKSSLPAATEVPGSAAFSAAPPLAAAVHTVHMAAVSAALRAAPLPAPAVPVPLPPPSPPRLLTGLLSLIGFGPSTGARPGLPVLPSFAQVLEQAFVAIRRQHQYIWHNAEPTITPELVSEDVDTGVRTYDLGIADADHDQLVVTVGDPEHGSVVENVDGTYTYTPNEDFAQTGGDDSFSVTVSDDTKFHMHSPFNFGGHTDTATVAFTVASTNKAPTITVEQIGDPDPNTGETNYQVTTGDPNVHDVVTYEVVQDVHNGVLTYDAPSDQYTYVPDAGYAHTLEDDGEDAFVVRATDQLGAHTDYQVNIVVAPQNNDPVLTLEPKGQADNETGAITYLVNGHDDDTGDTLTYSVVQGPSHGDLTYDPVENSYTYTPHYDYAHDVLNGGPDTDSFTVRVEDGNGGADEYTQDVTVTPLDTAPEVTLEPKGQADTETGAITYLVNGHDDDAGDTLTYSVAQGPSHGDLTYDPVENSYTYTPHYDYAHDVLNGGPDTDSFTVRVEDGNGGADEYTQDVTVTPLNSAPAVYLVAGSQDSNTGQVNLSVLHRDADSDDTITYTWETDGQVIPNPNGNGTFIYIPKNAHSSETATITVIGTDNHGAVGTTTIHVGIPAHNAAPTIDLQPEPASTVNGAIVYKTNYVDTDGDSPTYTFTAQPSHGTVAVVNGDIVYTPNYTWAHALAAGGAQTPGADSFAVSASDGHGGTDQQTVNVTVNPLNQTPTITRTVVSQTATTITYRFTAVDSDGDPIKAVWAGSMFSGGVMVFDDSHANQATSLPLELTITSLGDGTASGASYTVWVSDDHGGTSYKSGFYDGAAP